MDKSALTAKIRQLIGNYCPDAEIDGLGRSSNTYAARDDMGDCCRG